MSYELDNLLEESAEFLNKCNKIGPFDPNAEKNIPAFLNEDFDQYCASIENHLVSQGQDAKFLVGEDMTLADIAVGSNFMKLVFNDAQPA